MFRDARALDRQVTSSSFEKTLRRYAADNEKWFDGSVGSIDRRLTACDRLRHSIHATVARLDITDSRRYLEAAEHLDSDRRALHALRDDLLTGASNREDVVGPPGWRHAREDQLHGPLEPDFPGATGTQQSLGELTDMKQINGSTTPPLGASAGSNEFDHPAPRTNHPRYEDPPEPHFTALARSLHAQD